MCLWQQKYSWNNHKVSRVKLQWYEVRRYFCEDVHPWFFLCMGQFHALVFHRMKSSSTKTFGTSIHFMVHKLPKNRNHCDVTTPASKWSKLPLPVDGVGVRASIKFGLVSNYVFLSWLFEKCYSTQNRQKWDNPGIHWRRWSLSSKFSVNTRAKKTNIYVVYKIKN